MEDTIYREDATAPLKTVILHGAKDKDGTHPISAELVFSHLVSLPSAGRPQEWIPCSERMPKGTDGISECEMVLMTLSVGYVACGWINGDTAYVLINNPVYDQIVIADSKEVIAWMPLPEPWKGADDVLR